MTTARTPMTPMAMVTSTNRMYSHWKGAIPENFPPNPVGFRATQVVPAPPISVNAAVRLISTMQMILSVLAHQVFLDIVSSLLNGEVVEKGRMNFPEKKDQARAKPATKLMVINSRRAGRMRKIVARG